jgi:hypothetical protein
MHAETRLTTAGVQAENIQENKGLQKLAKITRTNKPSDWAACASFSTMDNGAWSNCYGGGHMFSPEFGAPFPTDDVVQRSACCQD